MAEKSTAQHVAETILPANSLGTYGTDTFVNKEPATKSDTVPTIVVYDTGGFDPTLTSDNPIFEPTINVRVIGMIGDAGYTAAQQKLASISSLFVTSFDTTVGSTRYFGSYQQGQDFFVEYNTDNRPIWSANYRLFKEVP